MHKAGFVNIIGSPNVGKSTLMNAMVGERLSIITSKAQTTRHRIMGIVNGNEFQIIYSDTPGILKPAYKLHEGMMKFVETALEDADVILFVTDIFEKEFKEDKVISKINASEAPVIILINKTDISKDDAQVNLCKKYWEQVFPGKEILSVSALTGKKVGTVFNRILELLPESEPYFPKDELTDKPERFFIAEIIREKIFMNYHKEIPYSCDVVVESFKEAETIIRIYTTIFVARDSQKGILIGHKGEKLKNVGIAARQDIEKFLQKKVYLEMVVKVDEDWRENVARLKQRGYWN